MKTLPVLLVSVCALPAFAANPSMDLDDEQVVRQYREACQSLAYRLSEAMKLRLSGYSEEDATSLLTKALNTSPEEVSASVSVAYAKPLQDPEALKTAQLQACEVTIQSGVIRKEPAHCVPNAEGTGGVCW